MISCVKANNNTEFNFLSTADYSVINSTNVYEKVAFSTIVGRDLILYNFRNPGFYKVDSISLNQKFINSNLIPVYSWCTGIRLLLDHDERVFICLDDKNNKTFQIKRNPSIIKLWFSHGILFCKKKQKRKLLG